MCVSCHVMICHVRSCNVSHVPGKFSPYDGDNHRLVPAFSVSSRQRNTAVTPPPPCEAFKVSIVSCHVTSCHFTSWYVTSWYVMTSYVM